MLRWWPTQEPHHIHAYLLTETHAQLLSTAVFLYSPVVRAQYAARHPAAPEPTVRFNDFVFGLHAWIVVAATLSQFWPRLWGWPQAVSKNRVKTVTWGLVCGGIVGFAASIVIVLAHGRPSDVSGSAWGWIDVVCSIHNSQPTSYLRNANGLTTNSQIYALTYVKLIFTIFKCVPQVWSNHQRKSTAGWSITQVYLDIAGGLLSLMQLVIDSSVQADWSGLAGNPVKFGLAMISLFFDVAFMAQHYVLYDSVAVKGAPTKPDGDRSERDGETNPLLA